MPGSLAMAVGSSSISHPSITEPAQAKSNLTQRRWPVARGVVRGGPRVSTADLPHLADVVLSCVHFYKRASTAGSLECRGRPWSRIPPRPTQGQPPAVGEVEGTTTRQHCSSAAIWRLSPRADTHERPPAKRHHACLPASLGLNHTSFWLDGSWIPNEACQCPMFFKRGDRSDVTVAEQKRS